MKKSIIFALALLFCASVSTTAQNFKWGIKAGISSSDVKPSDLLIANNDDVQRFVLNVKDAKYGLNLGAFFRFKTGKHFFIQPEVQINSVRTDYEIQDFKTAQPVTELVTESYHNINVPINMGFKFGPLRFQGGAIGSYHIGGKSQLEDYEGYTQEFKPLAVGWQAGIGLDIWKLNFDFRYEGDFGNYADHMQFFGNNVAFDDKEKQMKFAIGWTF